MDMGNNSKRMITAFFIGGVILFLIGLVWFLLDDPGGFEISILELFVSIRSPFLNSIVIGFTTIGNVSIVVPVTLTFVAALLISGRYRLSAWVVPIGIALVLLNFILKVSFARERPDQIFRLIEGSSFSFPSGHSMVSNLMYGWILLALGSMRKGGYRISITAWVLFSLLMGMSRLYVGVHYPSDVIAGLGLCYLFFPFIFLVAEKYKGPVSGRKSL